MKIYTSENCGELIKRSGFEDERIAAAVHTIVEDVKRNGDRALFACEEKFDKTILTSETVRVGEKEFEEAYKAIDPALLESIRRAKERILSYHMRGGTEGDVRTDEKGRTTGYLLRPVERAGIYTALIRERVPLNTVNFELLKKAPTLFAYSQNQRRNMLGGVV